MELTINRLKVLGEEDLSIIDKKISQYINSNDITILDMSIDDIKAKIKDRNNIYTDLQKEFREKSKILNDLSYKLKKSETDYASLNDNILKIEGSIDECNVKKNDFESKISYMNEKISNLRSYEQQKKYELETLETQFKKRTTEFQNEKNIIDDEIRKLENKMQELMQNSMTSHNKFSSEIMSIKTNPYIDDTQVIFDNIKFGLLTNLSKNILSYSKDTNFKVYIKRSAEYIIELESSSGSYPYGFRLHSDILKCKGAMNRTNIYHVSTCNVCNYYSINKPSGYDNTPKEEMQRIKELSELYFQQNYAKILENIIINPELLVLINKLNYTDFHKLFCSYEPFSGNINDLNPIEFIRFVAFIATNGYDKEYMKLLDQTK